MKPARGLPWGVMIAISVLVVAGMGLLGFAVATSLQNSAASATATPAPTRIVIIPTTTPAPTQVPPTATLPPTDSPVPQTPTASTASLTVNVGANVRGGPGTNYPILGGLNAGESVPVVGRDSTAQWFVVSFPPSADGQGWVAAFVVTYAGDINSLPVIAAPPPPAPTQAPPTATQPPNTAPPPATSTPSVYSSHGIVGEAFWIENTTAGVGQDVWFNFRVTNTTEAPVSYSVLAAHAESGPSAQSWTNETLKAKDTLIWRDHINFSAAGTYKVYLGICYGGKDPCLANQASWDRLSSSITVVIQ